MFNFYTKKVTEELDNLHTCDHYVALEDRFADFLALSHYRIIEKRKELYT